MSFFSRRKLKIILKDVSKKLAPTRKKSGNKQTPGGSKKESTKKTVMKSKMKAVIPKICQEKTLPKEPKKAKVKMVNLSAPSDVEIETETSAETEICNDSINLNTKEYFSEGKKEVNGAVERQSNHSDLKKEPEKTKDSCFNGEQKKGGMEPPESSVQPSMKKRVILILLYKGLQFREKLKTTEM